MPVLAKSKKLAGPWADAAGFRLSCLGGRPGRAEPQPIRNNSRHLFCAPCLSYTTSGALHTLFLIFTITLQGTSEQSHFIWRENETRILSNLLSPNSTEGAE